MENPPGDQEGSAQGRVDATPLNPVLYKPLDQDQNVSEFWARMGQNDIFPHPDAVPPHVYQSALSAARNASKPAASAPQSVGQGGCSPTQLPITNAYINALNSLPDYFRVGMQNLAWSAQQTHPPYRPLSQQSGDSASEPGLSNQQADTSSSESDEAPISNDIPRTFRFNISAQFKSGGTVSTLVFELKEAPIYTAVEPLDSMQFWLFANFLPDATIESIPMPLPGKMWVFARQSKALVRKSNALRKDVGVKDHELLPRPGYEVKPPALATEYAETRDRARMRRYNGSINNLELKKSRIRHLCPVWQQYHDLPPTEPREELEVIGIHRYDLTEPGTEPTTTESSPEAPSSTVAKSPQAESSTTAQCRISTLRATKAKVTKSKATKSKATKSKATKSQSTQARSTRARSTATPVPAPASPVAEGSAIPLPDINDDNYLEHALGELDEIEIIDAEPTPGEVFLYGGLGLLTEDPVRTPVWDPNWADPFDSDTELPVYIPPSQTRAAFFSQQMPEPQRSIWPQEQYFGPESIQRPERLVAIPYERLRLTDTSAGPHDFSGEFFKDVEDPFDVEEKFPDWVNFSPETSADEAETRAKTVAETEGNAEGEAATEK